MRARGSLDHQEIRATVPYSNINRLRSVHSVTADVAAFVLSELQHNAHIHQIVGIAARKRA